MGRRESLEVGRKRTSVSQVSDIFASAQVQKPWSHVFQRLIKGLIFSSPGWRAEWNTPVPPLPYPPVLETHIWDPPTTRRWTTQEQCLAAHLILHVFRADQGWHSVQCWWFLGNTGYDLFKLNKFPSPFSGVQRGQCFRVTSVMNEWHNTPKQARSQGQMTAACLHIPGSQPAVWPWVHPSTSLVARELALS